MIVKSIRDINYKFSFLLTVITLIVVGGCRGPVGPSGKDVEGVDVTPPTIHLLKPVPMSEAWDEFEISAVAIDNVSVREVIFYVDGGNIFDGELLSMSEPPYEATLRVEGLEPGWHFINARAIDTENNITDTPLVPVKLGHASSVRDTVTTKYHSSIYAQSWTAPDSINTTAYWSRFSVARSCILTGVSMMVAAVLSDTAEVSVQIWSGDDIPVEMEAAFSFPDGAIDTAMTERSLSFPMDSLRQNEDFFILLTLTGNTAEDTLKLGSDSGDPPWGRSGNRDDDNLYYISERFGMSDNFLISCDLFYIPVAE